MDEFIRLFVIACLVVVCAYVTARAVSFAYFRSKYEHFRRVMKELREGD